MTSPSELKWSPEINDPMNEWTWKVSPPHGARPPRGHTSLMFISRTLYCHRLVVFLYRYRLTPWYPRILEINHDAAGRSNPTAQLALWEMLSTLPGRLYTISGDMLDLREDNWYPHILSTVPDLTEYVK